MKMFGVGIICYDDTLNAAAIIDAHHMGTALLHVDSVFRAVCAQNGIGLGDVKGVLISELSPEDIADIKNLVTIKGETKQ